MTVRGKKNAEQKFKRGATFDEDLSSSRANIPAQSYEDDMDDFKEDNKLSTAMIGNHLIRSLAGIEGLDNLDIEVQEK